MSTGLDDNDKVSGWLRAVKRNTLVAGLIFIGIFLVAAATVTDSASKLVSVYNALFRDSKTHTAQSAGIFKGGRPYRDPMDGRATYKR